MGRAPCCDKASVKKGPWSPDEDEKLKEYIGEHGNGGNWITLPQKAGLKRCGKSCRLRWLNYLRPDIKRGGFSKEEDEIICSLYASIGSRWSVIATQLPGRTDNDIKNHWNTRLKKRAKATTMLSPPPQSPLPPPPTSSSSSSPSLLCNCSSGTYHNTILSSNQESFLSAHTEASCSSSDGSTNNIKNTHASHGREVEYEYGDNDQINFKSYFCDDGVEENQNTGPTNSVLNENLNGFWGDNPVDYNTEEIKQLISSSNSISSFLFD